MNTKSIAGASRVICEAMGRPNAVPATIAVALEAGGWLNTTEAQAELVRLRLLQNAVPAELTEAQTDALAEAGNRALNDYYHDDLCHCSDWPESCATTGGRYFAGRWDTAAFDIGMAAVIGAWESMRATVEADELAGLRDAAADVPKVEDPARSLDLLALMPERSAAIVSGHLARLLGEQAQLRARVAELETAQAVVGPYPPKTSYVVEMDGPLSPLSHKRPSLDEARKNVASYRAHFPSAPYRIVRWVETSAVVESGGPAQLGSQRASVEDPHDSPLHHTYRLGHDLPETRNV
ncbi:hypothetical protein ABZY44_13755 [Streptomyces sp. NPDC006544]|uniref:hypothetical protein n=1 Tax=Streptomyces sp. NPDC006544 TaxID=3154583 RepID=UPI0033B4D3E5